MYVDHNLTQADTPLHNLYSGPEGPFHFNEARHRPLQGLNQRISSAITIQATEVTAAKRAQTGGLIITRAAHVSTL